MKMVRLDCLFEVHYGSTLELNALIQSKKGINFVSRSSKNNGVSAKVIKLKDLKPIQGGVLTVAAGGSVLETFLQSEPFYSGRDLLYLVSKVAMSDSEKLFYAKCISSNRYKYNYGRQPNKTLKGILIPDFTDLPRWVSVTSTEIMEGVNAPVLVSILPILDIKHWRSFKYQDLFEIKKGLRLTKAEMSIGLTPFIGSIDSNNGLSAMVGEKPIHMANTISLSYDGSVAEAFYQPVAFWATDAVNVIYPRFKNKPSISLFLCALIKKEKYRYNYGRKWTLEKMKQSTIKLPVTTDGTPDWEFMENYIKSLPYSSQIENRCQTQ